MQLPLINSITLTSGLFNQVRRWWLCLIVLLFALVPLAINNSYAALPDDWQRYQPGINNNITDVRGMKVGHLTLGPSVTQATGATVILPDIALLSKGEGTLATHGLYGGTAVLNGNGEFTGLTYVNTFGVASGPIVLTATAHLGQVYTSVRQWMDSNFSTPWPVGLPIIGECWDGALNPKKRPVLTQSQIISLLSETYNHLPDTVFSQGRIGAGTGMRSFGLFGGIGSASRQVVMGDNTYIIGVLVNTNHSRSQHLLKAFKDGLSNDIGFLKAAGSRLLTAQEAVNNSNKPVSQPRQGSINIILVTDAPLLPVQLKEMAKHAVVGLGAMGSRLNTTSGDFALALSTAQVVPVDAYNAKPIALVALHNSQLDTLFEAAIEAVVAAQYQALVASNQP